MYNLRERNKKVIESRLFKGPEFSKMRESVKRHHKIDLLDNKKFPLFLESDGKVTDQINPDFSWRKVWDKLEMREADVSSSFVQFLRMGVNVIALRGYAATDTTYEEWAKVVPSKQDTEPYAPNHGVAFPRQLGEYELYPEVGGAALNLSLKNLKYGNMYVVSKELLMNDQTGQTQENASLLGGYLKMLTEVLCYGKLASVSGMSYGGYQVPVSETHPSNEANWPWTDSGAPFIGGGFNKPARNFGLPSVETFDFARQTLINQLNLQGLKMGIMPNTLIFGSKLSFDMATLLNSEWYPQTPSSSPGVVGGAFSRNPIVIKTLIKNAVESPFVFKNDGTVTGDSTAWYMTDNTKPAFVQQLREAVAVEQEAPNAGVSFDRDVYRFKANMFGNADFIDPRFFFQGNDGSVTS